jgi:hypothetical protein
MKPKATPKKHPAAEVRGAVVTQAVTGRRAGHETLALYVYKGPYQSTAKRQSSIGWGTNEKQMGLLMFDI